MYIKNRWVPMELVNGLLIVAALIALIIFGALYWFSRTGKPPKAKQPTKPPRPARKKRASKRKT